MSSADLSKAVAEIIATVRERGDDALLEYTERWDRVRLRPETLRVPAEVLEASVGEGAEEESAFAAAFRRAAERIERFHRAVKPRSTFVEDEAGVLMGLRWTPVRAVGLYVPGGKASYPSTLAMTAIPARIAGVERIVVVSPPGPDGEVSPEVLLAARILGIEEVYRVGGAQAIAALALGTETIPRVDKIFGPGNAFVAEAKAQLYGEVGIDLVAGPSEVVVYADETTDPSWVAADLMAQAEHDETTSATLLASSELVIEAVRRELTRLIAQAPRRETIEASLGRNGRFEVVDGHRAAGARIDEIAPEHLSLQVADPWAALAHIHNAGAIFVGKESPVAVGDYYAGPNHVLPTGRTARFASCLSVEDFMKRSNLTRMSLDFVRTAADDVETLATGERLDAHALSVRLRRRTAGAPRPRPGLSSVTPYAIVEEDGEVKLNQNESPWDVPEAIKDEVAARLRELPWNRYHQKVPSDLLAAIAASAGVPTERVVAASGSNLILQWIFEAWGGAGRSALWATPSFSLYPLWARVTETRAITVPLREDFSFAVDEFVEALRRGAPELAILCLPNNPTGTEMPTADVERIAAVAAESGTLLVVDEAYREFSGEEHDRTALVRERPNIVLVRTCSKAFSAAGMRLGYAISSDGVAEDLRKLVPPFHLNLFAAVFGQVLWSNRALFDERVDELRSERARLEREVSKSAGVEVVPSHANFFLVRVPDAAALHATLREEGVLVRMPGGDPALENCLRVNAGTREENDRFLDAFRRALERMAR